MRLPQKRTTNQATLKDSMVTLILTSPATESKTLKDKGPILGILVISRHLAHSKCSSNIRGTTRAPDSLSKEGRQGLM